MALFGWSWYRCFMVVIALLVVLLFFVFVACRIVKNETGICVAVGRVMSDAEHRQAFIRNVVRLGVMNSDIQEEIFRGEAVRTGIIYKASELRFRELVMNFYDNGRSFEENFNIKVIAPLGSGVEADEISEPFFIVMFRPAFGGGAQFIPSSGVVKAEDPASIKKNHNPNLYERFRGFGGSYYSVTFTLISVECCDNRSHYRTREEYVNRKISAYLASIESMNRGFATHTKIAAASNCGEVLTERDAGNIGTRSIKWIEL